MDFPPLFKNCPFLTWKEHCLGVDPGALALLTQPQEGNPQWTRQAGPSGRKTPSVQYLSLGVGGGGGSTWGHNCSFASCSKRQSLCCPPPPPRIRASPCLALLWAKECGGGSDDVWLPSLPVNRACKLLLSSPGPGAHQTRMKDLGRQRPGFPSPSGWLQRRGGSGPLPAPSQPKGYWDTQTVAFKPGNGQPWLNNWFLPHFRKVANCEGTQLYQTLKYNYT